MEINTENSQEIRLELMHGDLNNYSTLDIEYSELRSFVKQKSILLGKLLTFLEKRYLSSTNYTAFYYSTEKAIYVFKGRSPVDSSLKIPLDDIPSSTLKLKIRYVSVETTEKPKGKKERKIGYIIEKVARWRHLYNGTMTPEEEIVRYSLEDAANIVSVSKKSLDDYLLQLRFGRKYGFNFEAHKHQKVGILRNYNKKYKELERLAQYLDNEQQPSEAIKRILNEPDHLCPHPLCCRPKPNVFDNIWLKMHFSEHN